MEWNAIGTIAIYWKSISGFYHRIEIFDNNFRFYMRKEKNKNIGLGSYYLSGNIKNFFEIFLLLRKEKSYN